MEIRKPTALSSRIHGWFFRGGRCWMALFTGLLVSTWTTTDIFLRRVSSPPACRCHTTPALHQRGFVHVVTPINNHVTKANRDDFSPKRIKTVNRRVNKSGYAVYLTSTLVLINVMYSIAMERNRKLNVLGYSLIS